MTKTLWEHVRRSDEVPTHFQVFGERRSGTNFVSTLVARNLKIDQVFDYGWKHGFPAMPAIASDALMIVCVRDPHAWLASLHAKPFQAPEMENLSFSQFLRQAWEGTYFPKAVGRQKYGLKGFHFTRGVPLQLDRHPIEGRKMRNVLELRNLKLKAHAGLLERAENGVVVRYEDVSSNPANLIAELSNVFEIERLNSEIQMIGPVGPASAKKRVLSEDISAEDHFFISKNLDADLEARFGYSVSPAKSIGKN